VFFFDFFLRYIYYQGYVRFVPASHASREVFCGAKRTIVCSLPYRAEIKKRNKRDKQKEATNAFFGSAFCLSQTIYPMFNHIQEL
jgi:hypothetical protein